MTKDSTGLTGFGFQDGRVVSIVKDSSAARNGIVTDHQVVEINGRNVIGLKDKQICKFIEEGGDVITVTLMPSLIYDHMIKKSVAALFYPLFFQIKVAAPTIGFVDTLRLLIFGTRKKIQLLVHSYLYRSFNENFDFLKNCPYYF